MGHPFFIDNVKQLIIIYLTVKHITVKYLIVKHLTLSIL